MKKTYSKHLSILLTALAAGSISLNAQTKAGGISEQMLQRMQAAEEKLLKDNPLYNAITANSIDLLSVNHAHRGKINKYFSVETPVQNIHDQKSSGRCWMFTGLNVLRANFARKHNQKLTVEYSQAYLFFYDQLEKSNLMLQGVLETARKPIDDLRVQFFFRSPINDGGTFCGVADLADKYGLVPMSVMPETYSSENTSRMAKIISSKLREFGLELREMVAAGKSDKKVQARKAEMLSTVYHILCLTLGKPVTSFEYAFTDAKGKTLTETKKYTPKSFYQETVGGPINGTFIMVMNDPRRPYYKTYEVQYDRHTYDGHNWKYLNLPMNEVVALAIGSLKDSTKVYTSYDVGKQLDSKRGYLDLDNYDYGALVGTQFGMNKAQRIATFDSGSTHAMTLTAVDLDPSGKPIKWKVENSWGAEKGSSGYLIMTSRWFDEYMFRMVVDKKYVSEKYLEMEKQKPLMVMPEDPLFQADL